MTGRLNSKVTLVTGAASGIGAATTRRFVEEGATVFCADIREEEVGDHARELGERARAIHLDVRSEQASQKVMDRIDDEFGKLDVLVNNAGTPIPGQIQDTATDAWLKGMELNVTSIFFMTRSAWPLLVASGTGCVLNTASIASVWAIPGEAPYCTSKAAAMMMTKCLALDGAREGVRANCVCPGYTDTPMVNDVFAKFEDPDAVRQKTAKLHPLGRLATPEDIANTFVHLASDEASFITGAAVFVDGGLTSGVWGGYVD